MQLTYHTLDVFSETPLGGNPLAVVLGAEVLTAAQMQAVAREFNLSETVFVLPPENPAHSAQIRIFTPTKELQFAGHPTLGTAALLAEINNSGNGEEHDALIILEEGIGAVRVGVRLVAGRAAFAEFDAPKRPVEAGALPPVETLAAGLSLIPNEVGFENHKPACFAAGEAFAFVPVASRDALNRASVSRSHWAAAFEEQGVLGAYLYTRECVSKSSAFHVRMFAPGAGILEDPATGSAAICFAGLIHSFDDLPDGTHRKTIEQGHTLGRPSQINLSLEVVQGALKSVRIAGHAVRVSDGVIRL